MKNHNFKTTIVSRFFAVIILAVLLTLTGGCIDSSENNNNLVVKLHWDTGTLPPEYYYYYRITVGPGLKGLFEYQPGYGEPPAPEVWEVDFEVSEKQMDKLYQLIVENNLLKNEWGVTEEIAEGGSSLSLTIIHDGTEYEIPGEYDLVAEERSKVNKVTDYLRGIVPSSIWNEMGDRQSQFEELFSDR
jgi:hypothetical protein